MQAEFLSTTDDRYRELLGALPHDVYHTAAYLAHAGRHEGGRSVAFAAHDQGTTFLVPLLLRKLPGELGTPADWADATTPYGYAGPLTCGQVGAAAVEDFLRCFRAAAADRGIVSVFVRWHPLFPPPEIGAEWRTQCLGETVYLDLTRSPAELDAEVRSGHRYEIRRLEKNGFSVVMDDWSHYARFQQRYVETMQRVGARESYFFADGYFRELRDLLGRALHLGCVLAADGELAAAALFTETQGIVQYHLSATAAEFHKLSPGKLLLSHVRGWARQRGNRFFHLGGGLGAREDSLFRFKAGFSKLRARYCVSRLVVDPSRYAWLSQQWHHLHHDRAEAGEFFPCYRAAA